RMGAEPFDEAPSRSNFFWALLAVRKRGGGKMGGLEGQDRKGLSYDGVIRGGFALGNKIKTFTRPRERVGVCLPSPAAAPPTIFGLHGAGRVPAMLNFTAGAMNLKAALKVAGVRTILTSTKFLEQGDLEPLAAELAEAVNVVRLESVRESIGMIDRVRALLDS